uniref:Uncharacterized protein n=1 Tax=Ciona intestinalis TaxID=7719 RepID=H2XWH7_CIOIN
PLGHDDYGFIKELIFNHSSKFIICLKNRRRTSPTGFEPVRAEPNRFQICRLNHSATTTTVALKV